MDGADGAFGAVERGVELFAGLARVDDQRREVFALVGNRAGQRFDVLERAGNALDVFFAQHLVQALDQPVGGVGDVLQRRGFGVVGGVLAAGRLGTAWKGDVEGKRV